MMPFATERFASGIQRATAEAARKKEPASITGRGPQRSETAPATGWPMPHMSCATPNARLMVA